MNERHVLLILDGDQVAAVKPAKVIGPDGECLDWKEAKSAEKKERSPTD